MQEDPPLSLDLPASAFPMTLEVLKAGTSHVLETTVMEGPGVLRLEGIDHWGCHVDVRLTLADGTIHHARWNAAMN